MSRADSRGKNKMRVVIMYEHLSREADEVKAIAEELRKKGAEVRMFSVFFQYTKAIRYALLNKIDVLVLPWMYSDKYYNFMGWIINSNLDMKIVNLTHEEIGSEYSLPALLPRGERATTCVYHFVWGEYFADILKKNGVKEDKIVITGNGRTDFIERQLFTRDELSEQFSLDKDKKWLLFAESRGFVYLNKDATIDEHVRRGIDYQESRRFYDFSKEALDATIKDFGTIDNKFFENFELIYRPHPGTYAGNDIDKRIKVISDYSIYDWLHVVDANIVWSSTSIFESDAMGIPSIIYEAIKNEDKYRTFGTEHYLKISKINDVDEKLLEEALEKQKQQRTYENYYGVIDGMRSKNIASEIIKLGDIGTDERVLPPLSKDSKKKLMRLFVFENITVVFGKLGLIKKLKWPHMAYNKYSDIPCLFGKDMK